MSRNSVIICYGNHHFTPLEDTFLGRMLSTLSEFTHFKCAQLITPSELDDFCGRFHGLQSLEFVIETEHNYVAPTPITDTNNDIVPLFECKDAEFTRQFYNLNYLRLEEMMNNCDDPPLLAKALNKYILELRHRSPPQNLAQLLFGWIDGCKEFAWMFPYMRCMIDSHIAEYRKKLITTLEDAQDLHKPELSQKLISKHKWLQQDICFLIDAGMVYKTPVFCDHKIEKHQPNYKKLQFADDLMRHYCEFTEAHRILLSFCTFSTLTGT